MVKRCLLLILISFFCGDIFAQTSDTLRLFYGINEFQSEQNFKRIDSLITALNGTIITMKIYGYADFLHSTEYNQSLSQKRAELAKSHLLKRIPPSQMQDLICKGMGEKFSKDNQSKEGESFQRRVDIIVQPFIIRQDNYTAPEKKIALTAPKQNTKTIESLSKGESLSLEGLNFEPGRHYVVKEALPILDNLLKTLQENKALKIEIQGHICCLAGRDDGMDADTHENKLSLNRAKAVYDFLVKNGIDKKRLSYEGFGRSKPKVFPENTPEDEQMNRRVEIMIVEK